MIPPFGFEKREKIVLGIFMLAGLVGLVLYPLGLFDYLEADGAGARIAETYFGVPGKVFLAIQGGLVVFTGIGALLRSFVMAVVGIVAGLIFITPIGVLTVLPAIAMLFLTLSRRRAFREFMPRWKGDGPQPPGNWRF